MTLKEEIKQVMDELSYLISEDGAFEIIKHRIRFEAQQKRDTEIKQYIDCIIHGSSSYPNEHLREGLEHLKSNLYYIKRYLDKIIRT